MRKKMARNMADNMDPHSDNTHVNDKGHGMRQAYGASTTAREGILVDLSETDHEESMRNTQHGSSSGFKETSSQTSGLISNIIGLLPIPRGNQQPSQKMKAEEAQMVIDALRKDNKALQEQKKADDNKIKSLSADLSSAGEEYERLKTAAQNKIARLDSQVTSFSENNARLETAWKGADRELNRWKSRCNDANQQCAAQKEADRQKLTQMHSQIKVLFAEKEADREKFIQLNNRIMNLQDKNDTLRQMLVPVSEKQVLDAEVVQKFASLRSGIMGLVRQTWIPGLKHGVDVLGLSLHQQDLITTVFPITYERLRALVFTFVYDNIFESPSYFLGDDFDILEQLIQRVERKLGEHPAKVNNKLIAEWRNATFKATEMFRDDGRHLSSVLQQQIWAFLDPVQTKGAAAEQNGRKRLEAACDIAVKLGLMIRQLKDNFLIDDLGHAVDEPLSDWEELAEEVESVEANQSHQPGTIAYVIMGALVKNPQENLDRVLVLEKAEVAVYRQEVAHGGRM